MSVTTLEAVVEKINSGFDGGLVTRSDIANYLFARLEQLVSDADIKAIRGLHFDEKKVLTSILRGQNDLPEEIKKALRAHCGIFEKEKKKISKQQAEISVGSGIVPL